MIHCRGAVAGILLLLVCLTTTRVATAQRLEWLVQPGTRVRLVVLDTDASTGSQRFSHPAGTITGFDDQSVVLRLDHPVGAATGTLRVPANKITFARAFTGVKRNALQGAILGLVAGSLAGFLTADGGSRDDLHCTVVGAVTACGVTPGRPDKRPQSATTFAAVGALGGAGIGWSIRTDRWAAIQLASLLMQPDVPRDLVR